MDKNAAKEDAMRLKNAFAIMGGVENSATKKVTAITRLIGLLLE